MERLHGSFSFMFLDKGKCRIDDEDASNRSADGGHALPRPHEMGSKCQQRRHPE